MIEEGLFRREFGRMVTALTRLFGFNNLALAEDVAQDAFCRALEIWKLRGVPENPSAWLMTTAKNRAIDILRRERSARELAPQLGRFAESEWTLVPAVGDVFSAEKIQDDQLRMMFSCCDPAISDEAQIALILNLLCGFSAPEIAAAFLTTRAAIEKRITRGKKALAHSQQLFDLADEDFSRRLAAVQRALYLLFNEGYHGASARAAVRVELCHDGMRLAALLLEQPLTATSQSYALCALMWLHAARLPARVDNDGNLRSLFEQDRTRWDASLIAKGGEFLTRSTTGETSEYQVEAAIAAVHARASSAEATDWKMIVSMYDALMAINPSPVIALNRAIAIAQSEGPDRGLAELRSIADSDRLASYPFYPAAFGEMELRRGDRVKARQYFESARSLARNDAERHFLETRITATLA
ncbi:MAG: sigma factor, ECF subfamily protein [Candidatus Eremiobacteraeota bacterium]|nr:sigma factor, ECF subfamily protein [Candidatus Eremiobacteraeota bacterium]